MEIKRLNDLFRSTMHPNLGKVIVTPGAHAHPSLTEVIKKVQSFSEFTEDNDPYDEHDFGSINEDGQLFYWKIDYYNKDMTSGSEDPSNHQITTRILTIMLSSEY